MKKQQYCLDCYLNISDRFMSLAQLTNMIQVYSLIYYSKYNSNSVQTIHNFEFYLRHYFAEREEKFFEFRLSEILRN